MTSSEVLIALHICMSHGPPI